MKVGIVYDWIHTIGGAERIIQALIEIYPNAPIYTSVYNKKNTQWANKLKINNSFMQKIPLASSHHELFPFLTPIAFENFDFSGFDLIISVTSADSKGIITKPETLHISYILTPTRYLWSHKEYYLSNPIIKLISKPLVKHLKKWDVVAASRPDYVYAISKTVKDRIVKYYNKKVGIIYPPVNTGYIKKDNACKDYFLVISRLVPYKKIDLIINVFNKTGKNLLIIGSGRQSAYLRSTAKNNIKFLGNVSEDDLIKYYSLSKAVIVACEEDFGLVAVEAQSLGIPVIAYAKGGALETVINNRTGILFEEQNPDSLIDALNKFEMIKLSKKDMIQNAEKFSKDKFLVNIKREIDKCLKEYLHKFRNLLDSFKEKNESFL